MPSFPFPPRYFTGPNRYQLGILISLLSIVVFFAALILAFALVIRHQPPSFRIVLPRILYLSTGILLISSLALEIARHSLWRARLRSYRLSMEAALALGVAFLVCQFASWEQLVAQGIGLESDPRGSAFYIFTAVHGLHLLGGILGLGYVLRRAAGLDPELENALRRQRRITGAVALYWHSMGLLWLGLFALLEKWSR
jgi:cytochrome c oxidase subunit III